MEKMIFHNFEDLHREWMRDPERRKAYEAGAENDRLVRAAIDARLRKKMTQKTLARKMGTKQSAISRFESGKNKNPTLGLLHSIAKALGLEVEIRLKTK